MPRALTNPGIPHRWHRRFLLLLPLVVGSIPSIPELPSALTRDGSPGLQVCLSSMPQHQGSVDIQFSFVDNVQLPSLHSEPLTEEVAAIGKAAQQNSITVLMSPYDSPSGQSGPEQSAAVVLVI